MKRIIFTLLLMVTITCVASGQIRYQTITMTLSDSTALAYAANDVVSDGTVMQFTNAGMKGIIQDAVMTLDTTNTTNGSFKLFLFGDTVTAIANNAQFTLLLADQAKCQGIINFALQTGGSGSTMAIGLSYLTVSGTGFAPTLPFYTNAGTLWGVLVASAAYQPKVHSVCKVRLIFKE